MAFVESRDIDEITREVHYDANGVEHIATYTKNTSDNWKINCFRTTATYENEPIFDLEGL